MGIRVMIIGFVVAVCGVGVGAWGAAKVEVRDWGAWRVKVEERWLGAEAGWDWEKGPKAGIGLSRPGRAGGYSIVDYQMGWMAEGNQGTGVAGMLEGELGIEQRLEVVSFGREGSQITLVMVVHPTEGVVPESIKDVVRRKMGAAEGSRAPVSLKDAQAVGLQGKKVAFAGAFPEDLPAGEYQVVAELRDEAGEVKQRYERRLVKREKEENPLQELTDEQLLQEYVKRGEALRGTGVEPVDSRFGPITAAFPYDSPPSMAWKATHKETVRRGKQMVPALMVMLEAEAVRNPGVTDIRYAKFGFAFDVMRMLEEIADPRPVPLLVRTMEGMDGKANVLVRAQAEETTESLTFMSFRGGSISHLGARAVVYDGALLQPDKRNDPLEVGVSDPGKASALFAQWLAGEGHDPARWLPLARGRARKAMGANEPAKIGNAIQFLTGGYWGPGHDDQPETTIQAIARLLDRDDRKEIESKANIPLPDALAHYGPAARRYVRSIIDQARRRNDWTDFMSLTCLGGEQAVAYMVEALPKLRRAVEDLGLDLNVDKRQLQAETAWAVNAYRACRWGIERWAGRVFERDEEIAAWWERAKDRSQQQWLEESLERTAVEADRGNTKAQYILRCMVPDLPNAEDDLPFDPPWQRREGVPYREKDPGTYREKWVKENRGRLRYDERRSCFVIGK